MLYFINTSLWIHPVQDIIQHIEDLSSNKSFLRTLWLYEEWPIWKCYWYEDEYKLEYEYSVEYIEMEDAVIILLNNEDVYTDYYRVIFKDLLLELSGYSFTSICEFAWYDGICFYEDR